jgi:hypothetical protein
MSKTAYEKISWVLDNNGVLFWLAVPTMLFLECLGCFSYVKEGVNGKVVYNESYHDGAQSK